MYTFHDAADAALYVGKGMDIRHRVLDHLRASDEQWLAVRTETSTWLILAPSQPMLPLSHRSDWLMSTGSTIDGLVSNRYVPGHPASAICSRCSGVCNVVESTSADDERLQAVWTAITSTHALPGAIGILERSEDLKQIRVVRNWAYLGSAPTISAARRLNARAVEFDRDGYSVPARPLLGESVKVIGL